MGKAGSGEGVSDSGLGAVTVSRLAGSLQPGFADFCSRSAFSSWRMRLLRLLQMTAAGRHRPALGVGLYHYSTAFALPR